MFTSDYQPFSIFANRTGAVGTRIRAAKNRMYAVVLLVCLNVFSSCLSLPGYDDITPANDNAELYNTEWSNSSKDEGLKFYSDDTVMSFAGGVRSKGTFVYTKFNSPSETGSVGYISFDGLEEYYSSYTAIINAASIQEDGSMKLYWHKLGEDKGYYEILYRRR